MYESGNELVTEEPKKDPILTEDEDQEIERHNKQATDLYTDIRRLDSIIRRLTRKLKKCQSDEIMIKFANAIGLMTSKKTEMVCIVLDVEAIVKGQKGLAYRK